MKPYGRKNEPIKSSHSFGRPWKIDYHCHNKKHRKIGSWWEEMSEDFIDRGAIKQKVNKQIENELKEA